MSGATRAIWERNVDVVHLGQTDEFGNRIVLVDFSTEVVCQQLALVISRNMVANFV